MPAKAGMTGGGRGDDGRAWYLNGEAVGLEKIALVRFSRRWAGVFAPILTFPQRGKGDPHLRRPRLADELSLIKGGRDNHICGVLALPTNFPPSRGKGDPHLRRPRLADELSPINGGRDNHICGVLALPTNFSLSRGKGLMQFSRLKYARLHPLFACANFQREWELPFCEFDTGCMPCPPTTSSL